MDKKGQIKSGGLIAAGLQPTNRIEPCLTPMAEVVKMIFLQVSDLDEFGASFLFHLCSLLATMNNEHLSLVPVFLYWLKQKLAGCNVSPQLQLELDVFESLLPIKDDSFSNKNLRQIGKMSIFNPQQPYQSQEEFDLYQKLHSIINQLSSLTVEKREQLASSPFIVRFLSFLTAADKSDDDLERLAKELELIEETSVEQINISIHPLLYAFQFCHHSPDEDTFGKLSYRMDVVTDISTVVDCNLAPTRTLLHRALSKSDEDLGALVNGYFVSKKFIDTLFDAEGHAGGHGLLSKVAIGDFDRVSEQYKQCTAAIWRNITATTDLIESKERDHISKVQSEFNPESNLRRARMTNWAMIGQRIVQTMAGILTFIKRLPKVDPVAKDGIKLEVMDKMRDSFESEQKAMDWLHSIDGIIDSSRTLFIQSSVNTILTKIEKLQKRSGIRNDHKGQRSSLNIMIELIIY